MRVQCIGLLSSVCRILWPPSCVSTCTLSRWWISTRTSVYKFTYLSAYLPCPRFFCLSSGRGVQVRRCRWCIGTEKFLVVRLAGALSICPAPCSSLSSRPLCLYLFLSLPVEASAALYVCLRLSSSDGHDAFLLSLFRYCLFCNGDLSCLECRLCVCMDVCVRSPPLAWLLFAV